MNRCFENSPAFQRWVPIKRVLEVPWTAEAWRLIGASSVPKGTSAFSSHDFPSVKTLGYFQGALIPAIYETARGVVDCQLAMNQGKIIAGNSVLARALAQ